MKGSVLCTRCDIPLSEKGVCPKCGNVRCYVQLYHKKLYKIRSYDDKPMSHIQAMDMLLSINKEIRDGKFSIYNWLPAHVNARKLTNMLSKWLDQKEAELFRGRLSHGTLKDYRGYVRNHFVPMIGDLDIKKVSYNDLERFRDNLPDTLKKKTQRNILNALHAAFRWFWRSGYVDLVPPFPSIDGDDSGVRQSLTYDEQMDGLSRVPEEHRDAIEFGFETGLRPGEVCVLKKFDIKIGTREIIIQRNLQEGKETETTKGKRKRVIAPSDRAWTLILRNLRHDSEYLFINPDTRRRYTVKRLNQIWQEFSGYECCYYEAGRHSFCTQIAEVETNPLIAKDLMGHSDIRTTQKYCHPNAERLRDTANKRGRKGA